MKPAERLDGIEMSLIRQLNLLATPLTVNLGIGEPNLEPDETLRGMARRAATRSWHYSLNAGSLSLRKLVAEGSGYDPKTEVCITSGTQEALYAIFQAYVNPGDEVLLPDPGFTSYPTVTKLCGATPVPYTIEPPHWKLNPDTMRFSRKTKLVVVNTPSNPLGSIADADALAQIARMAADHGAAVVSDEVYHHIWYEAPPPSMSGLGDNVIVVGGMSKSHGMTGLRLGWIMARADVMKPVYTTHQYINTCASVFSQNLTEMIFENREWNAAWLESVRSQFRTQRDAALHSIEKELAAKIERPAGAFYAFVPVPSCDTLTFTRTLASDAAVLVIPGVAFGSGGEGFVRISYASPLEQIGSGIERMGRWLRAEGR